MRTQQDWIEIHKNNVQWVNDQIRICLMARRLLKGREQKDFDLLITHATEHHNPELLPLKQAIAKYQAGWDVRFHSFSIGVLSEIFDTRKFIYEARCLKWKEEEKPWLKTPA